MLNNNCHQAHQSSTDQLGVHQLLGVLPVYDNGVFTSLP